MRRWLKVISLSVVSGGLGFGPSLAADQKVFRSPVSFEQADARASAVLSKMSLAEKLLLVSGERDYYIRGFPQYGIPELYLSDATGGVNIRRTVNTVDMSTAFPAPIALAATWDPELSYEYAKSIGEECRVCGTAILLGPGVNIYRIAQGGRGFEYFGEDPYLISRMVERYVRGVLDTGTIPTLKHFAGNNTEFHRTRSNSMIDERTLHEIYLPAFKAGIDAGAMAVMTGYNRLNGEWCGQSKAAITGLLRGDLGFKWLVMTDWGAVENAEKTIKSGEDLEMPAGKYILSDGPGLLKSGKVSEGDIDRMAKSILRTEIGIGLFDRPIVDRSLLAKYSDHEKIALRTAQEGTVLLKNNGVLPLKRSPGQKILLTGADVDHVPRGGGSSEVEGFHAVSLRQALVQTYGEELIYIERPTREQLAAASTVIVQGSTADDEGWDHPFALPEELEHRIETAVQFNSRTIVIINAGTGRDLSKWCDRAAAVIYGWYPGQNGNSALGEILDGEVNPSGRLPLSIERSFEDSPGAAYIPKGKKLYTGWAGDADTSYPLFDIEYREGVFVGYRWYEANKIKPLFAFGHGLSYTTFSYKDLQVAVSGGSKSAEVECKFRLTNTGRMRGTEVAQIYVGQKAASVIRPEKELKGFARVDLNPGETKPVVIHMQASDLGFWDIIQHAWKTEPGTYHCFVGSASDNISLQGDFILR